MPRKSPPLVTLDELRELTREAVRRDGRTHAELAAALGHKARGAVSKALSSTGGTKYAGTLGDLYRLTAGSPVEAVTRYRIGGDVEP